MKASFISDYWLKLCFSAMALVAIHSQASAQDPLRFQREVEEIRQKYPPNIKRENLILFTGSSSVRMWQELENHFPNHNVVNAGFGGSQTFELLHYVDELILDYKPKKVFIYEGDNDISSGKSSTQILLTMHELVTTIHKALPQTEILLISAKPSISRWHLAKQYEDLNQHFKEYSLLFDYVEFVDIWDIMLDKEGKPRADLFLEDDLHMNKAGYDLWAEVVRKHID